MIVCDHLRLFVRKNLFFVLSFFHLQNWVILCVSLTSALQVLGKGGGGSAGEEHTQNNSRSSVF